MTDTSDNENTKKEGRIARHSRLAREAWDEPKSILHWSRDWCVRLWITKGGGFYGLGYMIAFLSMELRSLTGDIGGSNGVADFVTSQFIQFIIRFSVESFLNAMFAVVWPIFLLLWQPVAGLILLLGGYCVFRFVVRPTVETWFPELRAAREAKAAAKKAGAAGTGS